MHALIRPDVSTQVNVTEDVWLKIGSYFITHGKWLINQTFQQNILVCLFLSLFVDKISFFELQVLRIGS